MKSVYSPDLNPIEQLFAKLKVLLRKVATRTKSALWLHRRPVDRLYPGRRMRNYLRNCGYGST